MKPLQFDQTHHDSAVSQNNVQAEESSYLRTQSQLLRIISQSQSLLQSVSAHDGLIVDEASMSVLQVSLQSPRSRQAVVLDDATRNALLVEKLSECRSHLDRLKYRIEDTASKVLVTGDVNAGKSTLVNALLKRELLPMDQQPCTAGFIEVVDASLNDNKEEVHAVGAMTKYDRKLPQTFVRYDTDSLHELVQSEEDVQSFKVYCQPSGERSILHNGIIDVKFIDSVGLNRDSAKTMAILARQDEIDAVVFVVNSENHFTLSGVEFILEAGREKPFMFIAANRFDCIQDSMGKSPRTGAKERCQRSILKQIAGILPRTSAKASEFVHFVSAKEYLEKELAKQSGSIKDPYVSELDASFMRLEQSLRSFLIHKRIMSKLSPAKAYLENLISDLYSLAGLSAKDAKRQLKDSDQELLRTVPLFEELKVFKIAYDDKVQSVRSGLDMSIQRQSRVVLEQFVSQLPELIEEIHYPGFLRIYSYADAIIRQANQDLIQQFASLDTDSYDVTVKQIAQLYEVAQSNVELWVEQYGPLEDILNQLPNVSIDLALRSERLISPRIDVADFIELPSNLGLIGVTLGSATIITGGFVGYQKMASAVYHTGRMLGLETAKQWMWATVTVASVGTAALVLMDAKSTVKRRMLKKIKHQIRKSSKLRSQLDKVAYGNQSMLDSVSFEFRRNVSKAVEQAERRVIDLNASQKNAIQRKAYFDGISSQTSGLIELLGEVDVQTEEVPCVLQRVNSV